MIPMIEPIGTVYTWYGYVYGYDKLLSLASALVWPFTANLLSKIHHHSSSTLNRGRSNNPLQECLAPRVTNPPLVVSDLIDKEKRVDIVTSCNGEQPSRQP